MSHIEIINRSNNHHHLIIISGLPESENETSASTAAADLLKNKLEIDITNDVWDAYCIGKKGQIDHVSYVINFSSQD